MNITKFRRRLKVWQQAWNISASDRSNLQILSHRFFQFSPATAEFFLSRRGTIRIETVDTPHYAFATDLSAGRGRSSGAEYYANYLAASWGANATPRAVAARLAKFEAHFSAFKRGHPAPPIRLTESEQGGPKYTVDGNHRSAFAAVLGRTYPCETWPVELVYLNAAPLSDLYGAGYSGTPRQSVFLGDREVIRGRRPDHQARLNMLPAGLLEGATLLDVASNIGTNSILAVRMGAKSCLGLEASQDMTRLATRFAILCDDEKPR